MYGVVSYGDETFGDVMNAEVPPLNQKYTYCSSAFFYPYFTRNGSNLSEQYRHFSMSSFLFILCVSRHDVFPRIFPEKLRDGVQQPGLPSIL
jgi:hypothetical protein